VIAGRLSTKAFCSLDGNKGVRNALSMQIIGAKI